MSAKRSALIISVILFSIVVALSVYFIFDRIQIQMETTVEANTSDGISVGGGAHTPAKTSIPILMYHHINKW